MNAVPLSATVQAVNASEQKANLISCPGMAHRPTSEELDRPLSRQEVARLRQRLARLAPSTVIDEYRQVYEKCRIDGDRLPRAKLFRTGSGVEGAVARKKEEEAGEERVTIFPHRRVPVQGTRRSEHFKYFSGELWSEHWKER